MKKTLSLIALAIVATTVLSFGVARWVAERKLTATTANLHDPAWLKHELRLTDSQARTLQQAEAGFRAQLDSFCTSHCAARMALGDELAKSHPDPDKARACVDRMNAVQADSERATLAHILKVRALLDEPQARRYATLIHDQVCSMPMGNPVTR